MTDPNFIGPPAPSKGPDNEATQLAILAALQKLNGTQENAAKNAKKPAQSVIKQAKAIPLVGKAVKFGSDQITAAVNDAKKIHKDALGRGLSLSKIAERANMGLAKSLGDNVGSAARLSVGMEAAAAGMKTASAATTQLAIYTKLTGGNSKKLLKGLSELGAGMSISTEQEDKLSKSLMALSQGFEMTTDELMNSIKGLDKSMPMFKILGIGPEIAEATARLGAALGQESGQMASDMMTSLLSAEGAILASQLGVMKERNALLKGEGDTTKNALKMVQQAGAEASRMYESFLRGSGDPAIAYKAVSDALGPAMAKSATTYKQMASQAGKMGMSIDDYVEKVGTQNQISEDFKGQLDNLTNAVMNPLYEVMISLMGAVNVVSKWLINSPILLLIGQVLVGISASLIALLAIMTIKTQGKAAIGGVKKLAGIGSAASEAAESAGGTKASKAASKRRGGKGGGGLGKMLSGIGKGMAGLGKGFGKMVEGVLKGIARGVAAFGKPMVLKGALGMLAVGASVIPLAYALNLMKGVGIGTVIALSAALLIFGAAAFGLGALIGSGAGAVLFGAGIAGIFLLGVALLPLAAAAFIAAPGLLALGVAFTALAGVPISSLLLLGPALIGISIGMAALGAGGLVGGLLSWLTPGEGPVEKIVKMGKAATSLNQLAMSLRILPGRLAAMMNAMNDVKVKPFTTLATGLDKVGKSVNKLDDGKLTKLTKAMTKGSSMSMIDSLDTEKSFVKSESSRQGNRNSYRDEDMLQDDLEEWKSRKIMARMRRVKGAKTQREGGMGKLDIKAGRLQENNADRQIAILLRLLEATEAGVGQRDTQIMQNHNKGNGGTRNTNPNLPTGIGLTK